MKYELSSVLFFISLTLSPFCPAENPTRSIPWRTSLTDASFHQAAKEHKLILLDLEAIWCHWCHVMDHETYSDPEVQKLIAENFLAFKINQDTRPDLTARYNDYGWPATIILNAKGEDLIKRSGFIEPKELILILKKIVQNPVPQKDEDPADANASGGTLSPDTRQAIISRLEMHLDKEKGGLDFPQRFLNSDALEFLLQSAMNGNKEHTDFVKLTLKSNQKLIDPVWGGVYQYSTHFGWDTPHFEKIVTTQATNIRTYLLAYVLWKDPEYLETVKNIHAYIKNFLTSPEGAFYASQDADLVKGEHSSEYFKLDDAGRRKQGMPTVDKHLYSFENGLLISALAKLYAVLSDEQYLQAAEKSAHWILENRNLPGGGFRHDGEDQGGPFLRDTLAMGEAFLALYAATAEQSWLKLAGNAADFLSQNFVLPGKPGFFSSSSGNSALLKPVRLIEENIAVARFLNLLSLYTGGTRYRDQALLAMKWLSIPRIANEYKIVPGIAIADSELSASPLHVTVVGHKDDERAAELFKAAQFFPGAYKRIEWWDTREGPMPNADVRYPELKKPAAFVCSGKKCGFPVFESGEMERMVEAVKR